MVLRLAPPPPIRPLVLAGVLLCSASLAACGADERPDPSTGASAAYEGALRFARCMREHGMDVPDPKQGAGGEVRLGGIVARADGGEGGGDPLPKAEAACRRFLGSPDRGAVDPEQDARLRDGFVAFARCMRGEGIDMPDPQVSGGRVTMRRERPAAEEDGTGSGPLSARFRAAERTCRSRLGDAAPGLHASPSTPPAP